MLSWGEQVVFPRLVKPVVRICKRRVCRPGHRAQSGHQEDKSAAAFRGLR